MSRNQIRNQRWVNLRCADERGANPLGIQSVSVHGAPMRRCFYCSRSGSMGVGRLFPILGRHEYAHHACLEERRLAREAAAGPAGGKGAKQSSAAA